MQATSPQICAADFTAALIRRDMSAALDLLADDVVFFYSNGTVIRGKDAFAAVMSANWKVVENYEYATLDSAWIADSDAAASVIYSFAWSGMARGEKISSSGRGTRVIQKIGGGWRIVHEHLSAGQWTAE
jgi:ketosteroid isomerase-like protein